MTPPATDGTKRERPDGVKARLARSYGLVVLISGMALVLFVTAGLTISLALKPPFKSLLPQVSVIQIVQPWPGGRDLPEGYLEFATTPVSVEDLDHAWALEVSGRMAIFAGASLAVVLLTAWGLTSGLARRVARPLTEMAEVARESATDLRRRMAISGQGDELDQLAEAFNGTLDHLQSAFVDLEEITSHASHELRTSLAIIKAHLELGLSEPERLSDEAAAAIRAADQMAVWIDDVLSVSSRNVPEGPAPVDMALIAAEVVDDYAVRGNTVTLSIPPDGVPPARGHETWLRRALVNLVDNALKHGPAGGPVGVAVFRRFDAVIVSVTDRGPGIAAEERDRVWERHYRGDAAVRSNRKGFGLGLPLVRQAAEAAGGSAWFESRPEKGTTFFLSVPTWESSAKNRTATESGGADPEPETRSD